MQYLSLLLLVSSVLGTDFYITQPWAETKWKAGETVKITWKLYTDVGPEASGINLDLMDGEDLSANFLLNIANNLHPSSNSFEWTIPKTVNSDEGLFVRITGIGEVANYRFSHRFTIAGGEEPGKTMTAIPPVGPTVDVDSLIRQLPSGKKPNKIPPPVSLIDPDAVEVTTTTVSVRATDFVNRDRLAMSNAISAVPSFLLLVIGAVAVLF